MGFWLFRPSFLRVGVTLQFSCTVDVWCSSLTSWQHLKPPAPYHPHSAHPTQGLRYHPPSGREDTPAWPWRWCTSRWEPDCHWSGGLWVYLYQREGNSQWVKRKKRASRCSTDLNWLIYLCDAWALSGLSPAGDRGNRPMDWCQGPIRE